MDTLGNFASQLPRALVLVFAIWLAPLPAAAQEAVSFDGYYVVENGQAVGPLPAAEMEARVRDGRITETWLVWKKGMQDWEAARMRPDLGALIGLPTREPPPRLTVQDFGSYLAGTWTSDPAQTELPEVGTVDVVNTITFGTDGIFRSLTKMTTRPGAAQPMVLNVEGSGTYALSEETGGSVKVAFLGTSLTKVEGQPGAGFPDQLQFDTTIEVIDPNTFFEDGGTYRKVSQ